MREHGLFIAGRWQEGAGVITVRSPFDGREVARVGRAGADQLRAALDAAAGAREAMATLSSHERAAILELVAAEIAGRREELAQVLVEEAGKPLALARVEAERCCETFGEAARVARSPHDELLDLESFPSGAGRLGMLRRFPVGVVVGITPFNFPVNLVAHKLAPAVAAGCPIVLKPASQTPSPALLLAEALHRAGLPPGGVNVVPCGGAEAGTLLEDPRVKLAQLHGLGPGRLGVEAAHVGPQGLPRARWQRGGDRRAGRGRSGGGGEAGRRGRVLLRRPVLHLGTAGAGPRGDRDPLRRGSHGRDPNLSRPGTRHRRRSCAGR